MVKQPAKIHQFQLVQASLTHSWRIIRHRLFSIDPEFAPDLSPPIAGFAVWDLCFQEDLFQAENPTQQLLLDVGWYPQADPCGRFKLLVVRKTPPSVGQIESRDLVDWNAPVATFESRNMRDVVSEMNRWMS